MNETKKLTPPEGPTLDISLSDTELGDAQRNIFIMNDELITSKKVKRKSDSEPRRVFILRHGERVDLTFDSWITECFDQKGNYVRTDLNLPKTLPQRKNGHLDYIDDCPLTNVGILQAKSVGEALSEANVTIEYAFSSPALRCIQTCSAVLEGMEIKDERPIAREPGLFEWGLWYPFKFPEWMSIAELRNAGYNIRDDYKPCLTTQELKSSKESCEEFYFRCSVVAREIIDSTEIGNILIVGHATSLDLCTRQIIGQKPRTDKQMFKLISKIPYCSLVVMEEVLGEENRWQLVDSPCPPYSLASTQRFDWKILLH